MPPKPAAGQQDGPKILKFKVVGGVAPKLAAIAPKLSPLGVNPNKVATDIGQATKEFKGIKVIIELKVENRVAEIKVLPTSTPLVIKALGEEPRDRDKVKNVKHNGNITLDQIKEIAEVMRIKSKAKDLKNTMKEILGTCVAVGCLVEGKNPKEIQAGLTSGAYKI